MGFGCPCIRLHFGDTWASVQIPEGGHDFILDYHQTVNGGFRGANDVHFWNSFLPLEKIVKAVTA
jgi:hypothetical protein